MSDAGDDVAVLARQAINSVLNNVLNSRVVPILFHKSPGNDTGGDRAIPGIHWQVRAQGLLIQTGNVTGNDGRVDMIVRGGASTLELLHNGATVAQYRVRTSTAALDGAGTVRGQQQRLRLLGYQVGHGGPDSNGVDAAGAAAATDGLRFERSVLDCQCDHGRLPDANVDANTQGDLTGDAGA